MLLFILCMLTVECLPMHSTLINPETEAHEGGSLLPPNVRKIKTEKKQFHKYEVLTLTSTAELHSSK